MLLIYVGIITIVLFGLASWYYFFGESSGEALNKYERAMLPLRRHEPLLIKARLIELESNETPLDTDIAHAIREALDIKSRC